jgi:hypothetical protein
MNHLKKLAFSLVATVVVVSAADRRVDASVARVDVSRVVRLVDVSRVA